MVEIFDLLCPEYLDQLQQPLVGVLRAEDHVMIKHKVIACSVGHQHITVPVQNVTPGSLYTGDCGKGLYIIFSVFAVHHLQSVQLDRKKADRSLKKSNKQADTKAIVSYHVSPPILLIANTMGYISGIPTTLTPAVIKNTCSRATVVNPRKNPIKNTNNS